MAWCEANQVDYVFGLARNERLERETAQELALAAADAVRSGEPARRFKEFTYRTRKGWGRERRVIGKAEVIGDKCQSASKTAPPSASKIDPPFGVVGGSRRSASLQRKPFVFPSTEALCSTRRRRGRNCRDALCPDRLPQPRRAGAVKG